MTGDVDRFVDVKRWLARRPDVLGETEVLVYGLVESEGPTREKHH